MSDYVTLTDKEVKCRKSHPCDWCPEGIPRGQVARYRSGVFDGRMISDYMHLECYRAMLLSIFGTDNTYMPHEQQRGKTLEESDP